MRESLIAYVNENYQARTNLVCLLVATLVLALDYLTGVHIRFPIAYVLPVGMAAWQERKYLAYSIAVLLPLMRVGFHFPWHETLPLSESLLNAPIAILALLLYANLLLRLASQHRALHKKVKILEGILPICAACKKIRNEKGQYEQIEKYVTEHSEASFTHGLCLECARKLYPEIFKESANDAPAR